MRVDTGPAVPTLAIFVHNEACSPALIVATAAAGQRPSFRRTPTDAVRPNEDRLILSPLPVPELVMRAGTSSVAAVRQK